MIQVLTRHRCSPIGVDIGSRSIKMVQLSHDRSTIVDSSRWEWHAPQQDGDIAKFRESRIEALKSAYDGRSFRGRNAIVCLTDRHLFLQNIRVPKQEGPALDRAVQQEIASRIPFPLEETEIRFWEAADIRLGESLLREIIVFAAHRQLLSEFLQDIVSAGLRPVAVDVEPAALLRSYSAQFRRDDERAQRALIVHIGYSSTAVIVAQNDDALFVKYIELGGRQMDEAVSRALNMDISEANALRRRDDDGIDPEITRSLAEAVRPVAEKLIREVSLCVRYHSVTFRGKPLERLLVGGGEGSTMIVNWLSERLGMPAEVSDPFRRLENRTERGRGGQWDVAAGLALREVFTGVSS
jgi:type IV pilus assembly protein PilM